MDCVRTPATGDKYPDVINISKIISRVLPQVIALQREKPEYKQIKVTGGENAQGSTGKKCHGYLPHRHTLPDRFSLGIKQNPCDQVTAQNKKENDK